jgi:hypothetical protein
VYNGQSPKYIRHIVQYEVYCKNHGALRATSFINRHSILLIICTVLISSEGLLVLNYSEHSQLELMKQVACINQLRTALILQNETSLF